MMPEINSYSACVQLINHPDSFGDVREKGESAASVSVDPRIPIAGVGDRSGSLDCILGFVAYMTYMHVSPHGNEHVVHMCSCHK